MAEPALRLTSDVTWENPAPWFGGFSGAEVSDSGEQLTLISDRGNLVTASLIRTSGELTAVKLIKRIVLKDAKGRKLKGGNNDNQSDSEGLAISNSGAAYVSFERHSRVARLDLQNGITTPLPDHPDFAGFEINKGPEALAVHPDGTLYTLPERSSSKSTPFPLFAFSDDRWQITHAIPRRGPFLIVGADFDQVGRLYLLERAVSPLGFRSRIRRFDLNEVALGEVTLLTTGPGVFDNMEAISVWTDAEGSTKLTLVSDDNFLSIQRTQIVEFSLDE
ncbi:MAG: esterase-like activity of phytase family protein [Sulfitobacter sp.]